MSKKFALPAFFVGLVDQAAYLRWLCHKAQTHVRRDRRRSDAEAVGAAYRHALHAAVVASGGRDTYTGEALDWSLLSQYNNTRSTECGRTYKHSFALLPTVDHVGDGLGPADFSVCSWRVNDAKHDLDMPAFLGVSQGILRHHGFTATAQVLDAEPGVA